VSTLPGACLGWVLTTQSQTNSEAIKELQRLKHLAVVDIELEEAMDHESTSHNAAAREVWKRELISLLKDSPSTERKFLRWKIAKSYPRTSARGRAYTVVVNEELEASQEAAS